MRNLLLIIILSLLTSCCSIGVRSTDEAIDCPWQLVGSGTLVPIYANEDTAIFLTAAHVADYKGDLIATHRDGRVLLSGKVLHVHPFWDAALMEFPTDGEHIQPAVIDPSPLQYGDHISVPGYQGGDIWIVEGVASSPKQCSAPMYGGGSGAPVIDDRGRVRAIVLAVSAYHSSIMVFHHCHVLPLYEIIDWMESCLGSQLN